MERSFDRLQGASLMRYLHLAVLAVFSVCLSVSQYSFASNVVATSGQSIYKSPVTSEDVLTLNPANASGISFNYFDSFLVKDKVLKLVNTPVNNGAGYTDAAMLIVVISDNITIENRIELLGPATDILFLSRTDNGQLTCNSCSFDNFYRITLAAASTESTFPTANGLIGELTTTPNGSISINNLTAAGSLTVETLADSVALNGTLDTHDRAESEGFMNGYAQNQNGDYTIGTGSVNLMMGQMRWNYDAQTITKVTPSNSDVTLNGSIKSVEVKITSSDSISFNTNVDTRADLLATTQYKGMVYLPEESITIQDFGSKISQINNLLQSQGEIRVKSNSSINLAHKNSHISADKVSLITVKKIYNDKEIESNFTSIASYSLVNRGKISATNDVEIWTDRELLNEFGGEIESNKVVLISENGLIRNGSSTPYFYDFLEKDNDSSPSSWISTDSISNFIKSSGGVYYDFGIYKHDGAKLRAPNINAYISASEIEIRSKNFQNINPYWQGDDGSLSDVLNPSLSNQVRISAENKLIIESGYRILNSSAVIKVNNKEGILSLKGEKIFNERYRILSALDSDENGDESVGVLESVLSKNLIISPPGVIITLGDLFSDSEYGFKNDRSFVEVFGNAYFKGYVENYGITQKAIERSSTITTEYVENYDINQLDSLLYVHGTTHGDNSTLRIITTSIFDFYKKEMEENLVEDWRDSLNNQDGSNYFYTYETYEDNGSFSIKWKKMEQRCEYVMPPSYLGLGFYDCEPTGRQLGSGTKEFSIFDEVKQFISVVLESISEFLADLSWWSEE